MGIKDEISMENELHKTEEYLKKKEYMRKYRIQHKKEIKETCKKYYIKHRSEMNARRVEYYKQHREKSDIRANEYYRKNKKELCLRRKKLKHERGISKKYNTGLSQTLEYKRKCSQCRRKKMRKAGYLKLVDIQKVYDENIIANGGVLKCIYCGKELTEKDATLEHKQPITRGGTNDKENLAIACGHCNYSKGTKTEKEFKSYILV